MGMIKENSINFVKRLHHTMNSKVNKPFKSSKHHKYSYKHSRCVRLLSNTCDDNFNKENSIVYSDIPVPKGRSPIKRVDQKPPIRRVHQMSPIRRIDQISYDDNEICPNAPHNTTSYIIDYHRSELKSSNIFHNYRSSSFFHEEDFHRRYEVSWLPT